MALQTATSKPLARMAVLVLLAAVCVAADEERRPGVALEIELQENTVDGCTDCGCSLRGVLEPGAARDWWLAFGILRPAGKRAEILAASSHCGSGRFDDIAAEFRRTVGEPYLIVRLTTTAGPRAEPADRLAIEWQSQKVTGFATDGRPLLFESADSRELELAGAGELAVPVLVSEPKEQETLGVHEVLVRFRATLLSAVPVTGYGALDVTSDVPGAEILLDGGFVERVKDGEAVRIEGVAVGEHVVAVRDSSGREARREVVVGRDETTTVGLSVLNLPVGDPPRPLVPLGENPQGHEEYWRAKDRATVVRVPAGEFLMGSREGEGEAHERPQHAVRVSEFLIDKTEVTWRQFRRFAEETGAALPRAPVWGTPDSYPVVFVRWLEAKEYCEWVGGRLPTEAEWEKAARGTDGRTYPWGDDWDPSRCNSISGGLHQPQSVGSHPDCVSPYGVLDQAGNMWEWCADNYGESYYAESPAEDPPGPLVGRLRVMRGGAWMSQPLWLRIAHRVGRSPTSPNANHGFRCAMDPAE